MTEPDRTTAPLTFDDVEGTGGDLALLDGDRYEDRFRVGLGGMGEVRLVHDRRLDRPAVLKTVRADLPNAAMLGARLRAEAEITAALQHPGVVPVHDAGRLPDGRPFYVMREVRGRCLDELIEEHHADHPVEGSGADGLRSLISALHSAALTVAYAHSRSIIHRDLKPANLMVEGYGSVLVLDWGIARRIGGPDPTGVDGDAAPTAGRDATGRPHTRLGVAIGTPGFMSPEQAAGAPVGPPTDVWSLGACLHLLLYGRLPDRGSPPTAAARPVPEALEAAARRALAADPRHRFPDASGFAKALSDWLDDVRRREAALAVVAEAEALLTEAAADQAAAARKEEAGQRALEGVQSWDPIETRLPAWALEEEARSHRGRAAAAEERGLHKLYSALHMDPELPEAHHRLADLHMQRHAEATRNRDSLLAIRAEIAVRTHDRGRYAAWLSGSGTVDLDVELSPGTEAHPRDITVSVERFEASADRRLCPQRVSEGLRPPLRGLLLPAGSYRLRVAAPGHDAVLLPLCVERGEAWRRVAPGEPSPRPLRLPKAGTIGPDARLLPAAWFTAGGDPLAADPLPAQRWWSDDLVMQRHPVTREAYLAFLTHLWEEGGEAAARRRWPDEHGRDGARPDLFFTWEGGRPAALPEARPQIPVTGVRWFDAVAFAAWRSAEDGLPWRLPHELEREWAGRGADGRTFPWGDFFDPTFSRNLDGTRGPPCRAPVGTFPVDVGPTGVSDLAGNTRDWCINQWDRLGPPVTDGRFDTRPPPSLTEGGALADSIYLTLRGGAFSSQRSLCRLATRYGTRPTFAHAVVGIRLVRPL